MMRVCLSIIVAFPAFPVYGYKPTLAPFLAELHILYLSDAFVVFRCRLDYGYCSSCAQCSIGSCIVLNFSLLNNLTNCLYFSLTQGLRTQAEHRQILCQNVT